MKLFFFLCLSLICLVAGAQGNRLDDLNKQIDAASVPKERGKLLLQRSRITLNANANTAFADAQEALAAFKQEDDTEGEANCYLLFSIYYTQQQRQRLALSFDTMAYELSKKVGYKLGEAQALKSMGRNLQGLGQLAEAKRSFLKSLAILEEEGLLREKADVYDYLGTVSFRLNQTSEALAFFDAGIEIAKRKNYLPSLATLYQNKANIYSRMSQIDDAIALYIETLKLFETLKNPAGQANAYNAIGSMYVSRKDYSQARQNLWLAEKLAGQTNRESLLAGIYVNMGGLLLRMGIKDSALTYYDRGLALFKKNNDRYGEANIYRTQGDYFLATNQPNEALALFQRYLKTVNSVFKTPEEKASFFAVLGATYTKLHQGDKARDYLFKSLAIANKGSAALQKEIYRHLADYYKETGAYEEALNYTAKYLSINDTAIKEGDVAAMLKAQARYELEKKEAKLAAAQKEAAISRLEVANNKKNIWIVLGLLVLVCAFFMLVFQRNKLAQLKREDTLRRRISRDLHDDIGSTLSSINIYSDLAKKEKDNAVYLDTIAQHTQSILVSLDDLVWSINPRNNAVKLLVERMRAFAVPFLEARNIKWSFDVDMEEAPGTIAPELRTHIYLAFKELVNNVVKHANCTVCTMKCVQKGKSFTIEVSDNGKGFALDKANPLRNGLKNLSERAKESKGELEVISNPEQGSIFRFKTLVN